jgi:RNA polymerase sigma-70 factor (ECF subfamily)
MRAGPGASGAVIDDTAIIAKVRTGDTEAYGDLVTRHQAQVYRVCLAILADVHDAQDAAQAAFIKGYRRLETFQGQAAFSTWLTRIAINQCKDRLRQRGRRRAASLDALMEAGAPLPGALVQAAPEAVEAGAGPLALDLLEQLSPAERALIELVGQDEGWGYQELGARLGLSVNSVKGRLKRARQKLRRLWGAKEARDDERA